MIIRTGILCIPDWDEQSIDQIRLLLRERLPEAIVTDEKSAQSQQNWIEEILRQWADEDELSLILTIGGTYPAVGPSTSEVVPDATFAVIERNLPGVSEAMRAYAHEQTDLALLDRGVAGIRSSSVIINLPAGAASAHLFLEGIITLIPAILAHLNDKPNAPAIEDELELVTPTSTDSTPNELPSDKKAESSTGKKGLDPAEFAEFLRRQKDD